MSDKPDLRIDPEFHALSLLATEEEDALLRASLKQEGCREPLVVWAEQGIILDGHRRFETCGELGAKFKTKAISFASRDEAHAWVIANQLARRNLTEEQKAYLRGKRYLSERTSHGGDRAMDGASGKSCHLKTEQRLAGEYQVAARTIRNDANFAQALDAIAQVAPCAKSAILSRKLHIPRPELLEIARLEKDHRQRKMEALLTGKMMSESPFKKPAPFSPRKEGDKFFARITGMVRRWPPKYREHLCERWKAFTGQLVTIPWNRKNQDVSPWDVDDPPAEGSEQEGGTP